MAHDHAHAHPHHHTPRAGFSLLRSSVATRLLIVALAAAFLWSVVAWAIAGH